MMKIVIISDTHNQHEHLSLPEGDMIIHAGDVSSNGTKKEITEFLSWFEKLDYRYKIFIAGNHDFFFEHEGAHDIKAQIPENVIYLNDSGVELEGLNIWGSPIQPWFHDWAFNRKRGKEIKKHWRKIPNNLDILITHGPPKGIKDKIINGESVGCKDLLDTILEVKPKIHVFGHIHEGYGELNRHDVRFINASVLNHQYQIQNLPITIAI